MELAEEGELRPKLREGLAEELARELSELRSGFGDLEQIEKSEEDLEDKTDLKPEESAADE
jgi:hypothetical protein